MRRRFVSKFALDSGRYERLDSGRYERLDSGRYERRLVMPCTNGTCGSNSNKLEPFRTDYSHATIGDHSALFDTADSDR